MTDSSLSASLCADATADSTFDAMTTAVSDTPFSAQLRAFLAERTPGHMQRYRPGMEVHIFYNRVDKDGNPIMYRDPKDGNGEPFGNHRTEYLPSFNDIKCVGVSNWDWANGVSLGFPIDFDSLMNHGKGLTKDEIDDIVERGKVISQLELNYSKSGFGIHGWLHCNPEHLPAALTRDEHIANGQLAIAWLSREMGIDLRPKADKVAQIAWIYHVESKANGFTLIKSADAFLPCDWQKDLSLPEPDFDWEFKRQALPITSQHQPLIDWLIASGRGELKDDRLQTHTNSLRIAAEDKSLNIVGTFATIATGKEGPSDRNCFCHADKNGSWKVIRHGKGTQETDSWWTSSVGFTMTWFNRGKETKADPTKIIHGIGKKLGNHFHDEHGNTFIEMKERTARILSHDDPHFEAMLRVAHMEQTGGIPRHEQVANAIRQLKSDALVYGPEHLVAVRLAELDGVVYIDLGDKAGTQVALFPGRWEILHESPIRFLRPQGMLPLPAPLTGGSKAEFLRYVNVSEDDLPILMAWIIGCFNPAGPFGLLQILGEQGSAKSALLRFLSDLIDPHVAVENTLPRDARELLVTAQQRRLMPYDNVHPKQMTIDVSALFCMVLTGAASVNRKLFTDSQQSIKKAKRPIALTAIENVVTQPDLLDRTLSLVLSPIPSDQRKSEFELSQELRRDGVRGRLLGYILDGVAAAYAGHASVKRDDMPRLADLFSWATAAEPSLGIEAGAAIEAFKRQVAEESLNLIEDPVAAAILKLVADKPWRGSAAELSSAIRVNLSPRAMSSSLRKIAPDLRAAGYWVRFQKTNGVRIIELSKGAA